MSFKFNPFTVNFDEVGNGISSFWLDPVSTFSALPTSDPDGSGRIVKDEDALYTYDLATTTWIFAGLIKNANLGSTPNTQGYSVAANNTLTLQPANATNPGAITSGTQTLGGAKTFNGQIVAAGASTGLSVTNNASVGNNLDVTGVQTSTGIINANGGLDVTSTGGTDVLNIGTSGADIINIGHSGITVNVQGTTFNQNVTNLNVSDKLITINSGGSVGSGVGAGFQIEENAIDTGYFKTSGDRNSFVLKAPNTAGVATITPGASGIVLNQSLAPIDSPTFNQINVATANVSSLISNGSVYSSSGNILSETYLAKVRGGSAQDNSSITFPASGILVTEAGTETLTNKTLSGNVATTLINGSGTLSLNSSGNVTLPNATDTLIGKATTDTLTNKSIDSTTNTITNIVDANIKSNAAITRSKLASGTTYRIISNNVSGVLSENAAITPSSAVVSDSNGQLLASVTTTTELSYVNGVTSSIQTQLNGKAPGSVGDIGETSFSLSQSIPSPATITGFAFSNATIRSFEALVSVSIEATSSLYESFKLQGIQTAIGWNLSVTSVGDSSLITFSITNGGQVRYSSGTYSGFTSGTLKFRAITLSV